MSLENCQYKSWMPLSLLKECAADAARLYSVSLPTVSCIAAQRRGGNLMMADFYKLNLEYRGSVNDEIKRLADGLLKGDIGVISASRTLSSLRYVVEAGWPDLGNALLIFTGIDSETDALPIGKVREIWHVSTAESEDQKVATAEDLWREQAMRACRQILDLLRLEAANPFERPS